MYIVYAIYNKMANKIYIGQTVDIEKRIEEHNTHTIKKSYTARYDGEWILIYKELCDTRTGALKRERQLKSFQGRTFIKKYIPL